MAIRVYADTSVYGGVFDPGIDAASHEFFTQVKAGRFQLVVSEVVVDELQEAPSASAGSMRSICHGRNSSASPWKPFVCAMPT